jgi:predicted MFS family arabinose efflux permease
MIAAGLLVFGGGVGTIDVVMNIQAVIVEKASGRPMMSGFHGLFSVGGIAGAGVVTALLSLHLSPLASILAVVAVSALLLAGFARGLLPYGSEEDAPAFALPKGHVLLIGALCFAMFMAEGSVLDWSGVLLNTVRGLEKSRAGIGYVAFSVTMTVGRLCGDVVVHRLGRRQILVGGGICAASGFALASAGPSWPVSVLGFALVGVGASNVVPVLFTAAGRQTAMPTNLAVAAVTTVGYAGILTGPALIGFVARVSSLPIALLIVALMVSSVAVCAKSVTAE